MAAVNLSTYRTVICESRHRYVPSAARIAFLSNHLRLFTILVDLFRSPHSPGDPSNDNGDNKAKGTAHNTSDAVQS